MLFKAVTGRESFPAGSCQYHVLMMPTRTHRLPKETFLGVVAKGNANANTYGIRPTSYYKHPAQAGSMVDMGAWHENIFDVPDGVVLKVYGQRRLSPSAYGATGAASQVQAAVLLQTREGAALRRLQCRTTGDQRATFNNVVFEGRFDLLSVREAMRLGVNLNPTQVGIFTDRSALGQLFQMTVLAEERQSRPVERIETVRTEDGNTVQVASRARRRAIDLG